MVCQSGDSLSPTCVVTGLGVEQLLWWRQAR